MNNMSDDGIKIIVFFIIGVSFMGVIVGTIIYKKRNLGALTGFLLSSFTGVILSLVIITLFSFFYF